MLPAYYHKIYHTNKTLILYLQEWVPVPFYMYIYIGILLFMAYYHNMYNINWKWTMYLQDWFTVPCYMHVYIMVYTADRLLQHDITLTHKWIWIYIGQSMHHYIYIYTCYGLFGLQPIIIRCITLTQKDLVSTAIRPRTAH